MKNIILILIIFLASCKRDKENCHHNIKFINNSNKEVYLDNGGIYPDTAIALPDIRANFYSGGILPGELNYALWRRGCWEYIFTNEPYESNGQNNKISFFVYDALLIKGIKWDTVRKYNMYLKRYDLTLDSLQRSNFTITYQ